jgi:transposase InsO family protein
MTLEEKVLALRLFVMRRAEELKSVTEACRQLGISRTLFYRWRSRFLRYGADGLKPRPPRRARPSQQAPAEVEQAVLAYARLWPTHGPARIAQQLTRPGGPLQQLSASGAYAILKRQGLSSRWERLARTEVHAAATAGLLTERTRAALQEARGSAFPHVQAERPGELVSLDTFYIGQLKGVGKVWQYTACDAACSFAIAWLSTALSARHARRFLRRYLLPLYQHAGHAIRAVLTDGGSEWQGEFTAECRRLGIEHRRTRPRHAWTNGFVERLQGTILTELWRCSFRRTFYTAVAPMQRDLDRYLRFYNFERAHQGYRLKGRTPAEIFYAHE